jgi:hypothetical protein
MKTLVNLTRAQIQRGDYQPFLEHHGEESLLNGLQAEPSMGTITISIKGYSDRWSATILNPQVRAFLRTLHRRWPGILYFGDVENEAMKFYVLAQLDEIWIRTEDGDEGCRVLVQTAPLVRWLHNAMPHVVRLGDRAGLEDLVIKQRMVSVLRYFSCSPEMMQSVLQIPS